MCFCKDSQSTLHFKILYCINRIILQLNIANTPAWKYSDIRKEWYLHNFLEDMPDLNLTNPDVVNEFKVITQLT